jgi:CHAD domain-containing protein
MRAVIWLGRHSSCGLRLKKLRAVLRDLGHTLGERRTLDVLEKDAVHYKVKSGSIHRASKKAQAKILELLKTTHQKTIEELIIDAEKNLQPLSSNDFRSAVAELIVRLDELQRHRPKKETEWHQLRIEIKKIRYASDLLGLKTSEIKQLQDLLGKGHDLAVLMERLGHQARVESEMKKCWAKAKKLAPIALSRSRERLLEWRRK